MNLTRRDALRGGAAVAAVTATATIVPATGKAATPADPAIAAVNEWYEARRAYLAHHADVEVIHQRLPEHIRKGSVYLGEHQLPAGSTVPESARAGWVIDKHFSERGSRLHTKAERAALELGRRDAHAALRRLNAEEGPAYRSVGMPYAPKDADDYWEPWFERIDRAEDRIEATPATTSEGVFAKIRHVADFVRLHHSDRDGGLEHDELEHEDRTVLAMAAGLERLVGGVS